MLIFFRKMEEKTNLSVEVSRGLQKQLEIQLESTSKQLRLMEEETRNLKHELLHLNDANTKLQKKILEIESQKHDSLVGVKSSFKHIIFLFLRIIILPRTLLSVRITLTTKVY